MSNQTPDSSVLWFVKCSFLCLNILFTFSLPRPYIIEFVYFDKGIFSIYSQNKDVRKVPYIYRYVVRIIFRRDLKQIKCGTTVAGTRSLRIKQSGRENSNYVSFDTPRLVLLN